MLSQMLVCLLSLLSNRLFLYGCLEIFFVSLWLGNLSRYHLDECLSVALQPAGSSLSSGLGSYFLFCFFNYYLSAIITFSLSGTPIIWASTSMTIFSPTMSISFLLAQYFEIFLLLDLQATDSVLNRTVLSLSLFFFLTSLLEYNCFTMVC